MELHIADLRTLPLEQDYDRVLSCLGAAERQRAQRFFRREDRVRSAVGALLIRRGAGTAPDGTPCRIIRGPYGKPEAEGPPELRFSLSHSGSMIVFLKASVPVGVDVEALRDIDLRVFGHFLNAEEKELIQSGPDPNTAFFRVWTMREAFSKQTGLGLPLFEREECRIDYANERVFRQGRLLRFRSFLLAGHMISLCAETIPAGLAPHLITPGEWRGLLF